MELSRPAVDVLGREDLLTQLGREYEIFEVLGTGSTAVVRRALRKCDGRELGVKIMRTEEPELVEVARKEVELLKALQHPHIIKAYDFRAAPRGVAIVLEFFSGLTLEDTMRQSEQPGLSENVARGLFKALIGALACLHSHGIVHRDVKAGNVLVSKDLTDLRLVDFNTAQRIEEGGALSMTGTRDWSAPEVLHGRTSPGMPQDVWGAGLCLFVMLYGGLPRNPYRYQSSEAYAAGTLKAIASALRGRRAGRRPTELCSGVLRGCLEEEPDERQAAQAVLDMTWLQ